MILWIATIWLIACILPALNLYHGHDTKRENGTFIIAAVSIALSVGMYALTYRKLKKQSRNMASKICSEGRAQEIKIMKEKTFLNTIITIACVALLSALPALVFFHTYEALGCSDDILAVLVLKEILTFLFQANFAVNPLIYVLRLPNYRKTFYLLYWRRGCRF